MLSHALVLWRWGLAGQKVVWCAASRGPGVPKTLGLDSPRKTVPHHQSTDLGDDAVPKFRSQKRFRGEESKDQGLERRPGARPHGCAA